MGLIIHAPNVNSEGGKALLSALLEEADHLKALQADARFEFNSKKINSVASFRISPNIFSRMLAEIRLFFLCEKDDEVLCFGNLPPLFPIKGNVTIYLQNRFLIDPSALKFSFSANYLKLLIEKVWLKFLRRNAQIFVQTKTMKRLAENIFPSNILIMPFVYESEKKKKIILKKNLIICMLQQVKGIRTIVVL